MTDSPIFSTLEDTFEYWNEVVRRKFRDERKVFFVVSYYNWFDGWHEFMDARVFRLEDAERIAQEQSVSYKNCMTKVSVGEMCDLSLWFEGRCLYASPITKEYVGKDYEDVWR